MGLFTTPSNLIKMLLIDSLSDRKMRMKIFVSKKQFPGFFFILLMICIFSTGCKPYGPALPFESVDEKLSEKYKMILSGLYERNPGDVFLSIRQLRKMGDNAVFAVPYLSSMLTDRRLAKERVYGFVKPAPIFKEIAIALGTIGENGVFALVDSLKGTSHTEGFDDDFIREAVAEGLKTAIKKWGLLPFQKMQNTERVLYIMEAVNACLNLESEPGLFDTADPRNNLKFYKHFPDSSDSEGLRVYIEALGYIGDERALALLAKIVPLSTQSRNTVKVKKFCQFQRAASIAQYKIKPLAVSEINPILARILFVEFIAAGDLHRVNKMLEDGVPPDTKTFAGELAISLAYKNKHVDIFNLLVEKGASIDYILSKNDTLLIRAAAKGDYGFVKLLIENGVDLSRNNNAKETAITAALNGLLKFWDRRSNNKEAEPYLNIITLLRNSGSPPVPKKILKSLDKKALKILGL